jgi:hypothetical protein
MSATDERARLRALAEEERTRPPTSTVEMARHIALSPDVVLRLLDDVERLSVIADEVDIIKGFRKLETERAIRERARADAAERNCRRLERHEERLRDAFARINELSASQPLSVAKDIARAALTAHAGEERPE